MPNSFLSVRNLHISHEKKNIGHDLSLDVQKGEVFGLVGLNGVGKTTLIKTILGLREADGGGIEGQAKDDISYLPEKFEPPAFLTGRQFIEFSLKLYGINTTKSDINKKAENLSFDVSFLDQNVGKYSKGMKQKIGLIAAILCNRDLTILDEPMSGLDPKARIEVKNMIKTVKGQGRSVFFSSHILTDISQLCDRMAVLHDQNFVFQGTPEEFLEVAGHNDPEKAFLTLIQR